MKPTHATYVGAGPSFLLVRDCTGEHAMASHERTSEMGDVLLHVLGRYYSKVEQSELALFHYSEALSRP